MSEYDDGFDAGILHQCLQERDEDARREHKQRVAVFGAIRRAAEVARRYDCECLFPGHNSIPRGQAAVVRQAIRAAIGSDKA